MGNIEYITEFLKRVEGWYTDLYIPCYKKSGGSANYRGAGNPADYTAMGASGCTVGIGCDLGQTDRATLLGYGVPAALVDKLAFYIGKKKAAAIDALYRKPLSLSDDEAWELTLGVHKGYLEKYVIPVYEKKSGVKFSYLPVQAQAVVMSVCYQKGVGGVQRDWPKLWKYLIMQDWRGAARELKTGFSQYKARRKIEGELLEELL